MFSPVLFKMLALVCRNRTGMTFLLPLEVAKIGNMNVPLEEKTKRAHLIGIVVIIGGFICVLINLAMVYRCTTTSGMFLLLGINR